MIDPITQYRLSEGYLLSDKTISVNLKDFVSGKSNKLLIVGVSGSGKTTLGEKLSKQLKLKWYSIDSFWWRLKQEHFPDKDKYDKMTEKEKEKDQLDKLFNDKVMTILKNNERCIIEGINLMEPYFRKLVLKESMIVIGLSSLRAGIQAGMRNKKRGEDDWRVIYQMPFYNMKNVEPHMKSLRKDITKIKNVDIKEYQI